MMMDVSKRSLSAQVLGTRISMPIVMSPTGLQKMAHPEGEIASVKAAEKYGTIFILSTMSNSSIEEIAEAAPNCAKWFQLYIQRNRQITEDLVKRAEQSGYKALVLTVDCSTLGRRLPDIRNQFQLPPHLKLANFQDKKAKDNFRGIVHSMFSPSISWSDLQWLKSRTTLPIVVKGILHPQDAILAIKHGAKGIMVSNHGGRQLDGVLSGIDALEEIVDAVKEVDPRVEIYMDGGVRQGTDVLKALALGAKMVGIGRPVLWGLTYKGQEGVELTLDILKKELDACMGLAGVVDAENVNRDLVLRTSNI